jgi:hypothetical protein
MGFLTEQKRKDETEIFSEVQSQAGVGSAGLRQNAGPTGAAL